MPQRLNAAPPLSATYRIQLSRDFDLAHARSLVGYLDRLGISHLYASPILAARTGSTHGYDVVNPECVNPELGGEDARTALVTELRAHGMGMLLDIVPNHMGTGPQNPFWTDVLKHGQASQYATWFDIDWDAPGPVRGRVLVPVLGDTLDAVIERDELHVVSESREVFLKYYEHRFPLAPDTAPGQDALGEYGADEAGRARLHALLDRQHYVLADWRRAAAEINYRRFFDISDLIAVRVDDPTVFDATHALFLSWIADGTLDGLRVDHIDGLRDPLSYLRRLRESVQALRPGQHVPIFVEKILSHDERLRVSWPIDGTTGYEFLNELESIFVSPSGVAAIERDYRVSVIHASRTTFHDVATRGKLDVLRKTLSADVARLLRLLASARERTPSRAVLARGVRELIAVLPVYRTYVDARGDLSAEDRSLIERSALEMTERWPRSAAVAEVLKELLLDSGTDAEDSGTAPRRFTLRFQQTSGPAAAKGIEDTALYRYVPLASLGEVGGAPDRPLDNAVDALHGANAERGRLWPHHMLATSTHDTKRSADVRARLDVLSEMPDAWTAAVKRWRRMNRMHGGVVGRRRAPDANIEYLLYQTLVAVWRAGAGEDERRAIADRVDAYMQKAARESRLRTSWIDPDAEFEHALSRFVQNLVLGDHGAAFRDELDQVVRRIATAGMWNALARTLVHLTAPGTPDLYQGDELWNLALVDPDNRRAVDYDLRTRLLEEIERRSGEEDRAELCRELVAEPSDDRLKLYLIRTVLHLRRDDPALFEAEYVPLRVTGARAEHVFAFARVSRERVAVIVVPRLPLTLCDGAPPVGTQAWRDTAIALPPTVQSAELQNAFTGARLTHSTSLQLAEALAVFPVALLTATIPMTR